jgi:hypothetical protein
MAPDWLAMNKRPPTIAGCERDCVTSAMPNAHLSFRFATLAAVMPPPSL